MKRQLREIWRERLGRVPPRPRLRARRAARPRRGGRGARRRLARRAGRRGAREGGRVKHPCARLVRAFFPLARASPARRPASTTRRCSQYASTRCASTARQGLARGRLAAPALQPVEPRRGGLRRDRASRDRQPMPRTPRSRTPLAGSLDLAARRPIGLSWAWSIVALTIIVRIALVPLTVKQIHSMQQMQAHVPEMKAIQQKYKGDRQQHERGVDEVLQGEQASTRPRRACRCSLQLPVFFALYFVLRTSTNHVQAPAHEPRWLTRPEHHRETDDRLVGYVLLVVYVAARSPRRSSCRRRRRRSRSATCSWSCRSSSSR